MKAAVLQIPGWQHFAMEMNETALIKGLSNREEAAFEEVFKTYFKRLHAYAFAQLKSEAAAEEIVQNVFYKLWERTERLSISGSLAAYLYRAVNNESLNYLKHQKVKAAHGLYVAHNAASQTDTATKKMQLKELETKLQAALSELPEQCRTIFQLSRFEELRYSEIAARLGLSVKTIENQMGKALKLLRNKLAEFLPLTLFLFLNYLNGSI